MLLLTAADVRAAITMRETIEAVRAGFIALSANRVSLPLRSAMSAEAGTVLTMPAHIHGEPVSTVKVVSVYPQNPARGLPTVIGSILVVDADTGQPQALVDGTSLTAMRTGAASGLATDLLAAPQASTLGVIGAGKQARTQIEAICVVRPIQRIRIYSLNKSESEQLAAELHARYGVDIAAAERREDALKDAAIIVAATNSKTPVVYWTDLSPGAHINGIGSFTPEMQEVDHEVVAQATVVVDHRESAWAEAGDLIIARNRGLITEDDIHAEIGEIAAGSKPGRTRADEVTFFKSVGNAVQDAAVAARVLAAARARGLGASFDF